MYRHPFHLQFVVTIVYITIILYFNYFVKAPQIVIIFYILPKMRKIYNFSAFSIENSCKI